MYYEVLWYPRINENGNYDGDPISREFKTKKAALNYYEKHKDDEGCFGWWVTQRDEDGCVLDDLVY